MQTPTPRFFIPDTYLILLGVALFAFALTYLVPQGAFDVVEVIDKDGKPTQVLDPGSFNIEDQTPKGLPVFATEGNMGFLNFAFEGLVSGSKWGASIGVFAFILIAGGAFGIITATGAVNRGILGIIGQSAHADIFVIPLLFFVFSLGGAVFGMGEEAIPFVLILVPILITMGYDSITGVLITYVATQVGFACSWMNPFSLSIAQGIAQIPILSGANVRILVWCFFTVLGCSLTTLYALRIKKAPQKSLAFMSDNYFREQNPKQLTVEKLSFGDWLILATLIGGVIWVVWGVTQHAYYLPEIATQFFSMGLIAGIIASIFKLNGMTSNKTVDAFRHGAMQLLPAALIVGFASGIVLMLGSNDPSQPSVLNTILFYTARLLEAFPAPMAAASMYVFQSVFNFFITSGSGQAALTMPLMAPLADLVGVSRQVAVLAFQLGDGFTNIVVPTSAALMGSLGAARLEWGLWIKFIIKPFFVLFLLALLIVVSAVIMDFQ